MPELRKVIVIGGGFAGIACAIHARKSNPLCHAILLEKGDKLLGWMDRKGLTEYPIGSTGKPLIPFDDNTGTCRFQQRLLEKWDCGRIGELFGINLETTPDGKLVSRDLNRLRSALTEALDMNHVELRLGFSVESVSAQPDGSFRVWSRGGDSCHGDRIILATGGERNHGLRIAADFGVDVTSPVPAFVRLRLASPKLGDRMGPLERHVKVRCLRTGSLATGSMTISPRGLEGPAISSLSASQCMLWNKLNYQLQLEVDWLPGQTGTSVLREIVSRSESCGKRPVADTPLFAFPVKSWRTLLKSAKVDEETNWSRLKMKKLQALANRIKADRVAVGGMGLPEDERAWSGGVSIESLNQQTLEAQSSPGIYFAGEILNIHGLPGGDHQNRVWATAWLAGRAAVEFA